MITIALQDRDIKIFKVLSSGPTPFNTLFHLFKKIYRTGGDATFSESVIRCRLTKLIQGGYISSRRYPQRNKRSTFGLYILTPLAAEELAKLGYGGGDVRMTLPSSYHVAHELEVTDVVRALKRESVEYGFEITIRDETTLRSVAAKKKRGKGNFYPDLLVQLILEKRGEVFKRIFLIEVDNDTEVPMQVFEKYKLSQYSVIYVCPTLKRIQTLCAHFNSLINDNFKDGPEKQKLKQRAYFVDLGGFCVNGFLESNIINLTGDRTIIIPSDYIIRKIPRELRRDKI